MTCSVLFDTMTFEVGVKFWTPYVFIAGPIAWFGLILAQARYHGVPWSLLHFVLAHCNGRAPGASCLGVGLHRQRPKELC